jgi:hypothetical protein
MQRRKAAAIFFSIALEWSAVQKMATGHKSFWSKDVKRPTTARKCVGDRLVALQENTLLCDGKPALTFWCQGG